MKVPFLVVTLSALIYGGYAFNCYHCPEGCLLKEAKEIDCGQHISSSQKQICTLERKKDVADSLFSVRRCRILNPGTDYACPSGYECDEPCTTDLCNGSSRVTLNLLAVVGTIFSVVVAKFVF